jgi:L-amino acid N-acyltransferase YncA
MLRKWRSFVTEFNFWRAQHGWLRAARAIVRRLHIWAFTYWGDLDILAVSLDQAESLALPPAIEGLTMRQATLDDIPAFAWIATPHDVSVFARRIAHGRQCYVALDNAGNVVAYRWASAEVDEALDRLVVALRPDEVYFYGAYTAPCYRRRGVMRRLKALQLQDMRAQGFQTGVTLIRQSNTPSLTLWQKTGAQGIGQARFLKLLGQKFFWQHRDD